MDHYVPRTLCHLTAAGEPRHFAERELLELGRSLVILGEPGIGKTSLLRRLAEEPDHTFRSASSFVAHPHPASLLDIGDTIVVDGLDELAAAKEADPVNRVLGQLIATGRPRFVLSCRAADWRGAVARQDIADEYGEPPLELTLEPLTERDAATFLTHTIGERAADRVVEHLREKGLAELLGSPLTLTLFGEVAALRDLPETRADLMQAAVETMWSERNDRHEGSTLAAMNASAALGAAGAVAAACILTGAEAITLKPSAAAQDRLLPVSELTIPPGGEAARALVGSRLFQKSSVVDGALKPIHRSVAEYLGARWLSSVADDIGKRERVLAMMTIDAGVPASLRGIHAWLAKDEAFAMEVIATDPYAVLRYGYSDHLTVAQARALLLALKKLQRSDPFFRAEDWGRHSARGLAKIELLPEVRDVLLDPNTSLHLRTLLLNAVAGSALASALAPELRNIGEDIAGKFDHGERLGAIEAIAALDTDATDWPALIDRLLARSDESSRRLAIETMDEIGYEGLDGALVAKAIMAYLGLLRDPAGDEEELGSAGTLYLLARRLPVARIASVLDWLADQVPPVDPFGDQRERSELASTVVKLINRQVQTAEPAPLTLLKWMRLTPGDSGYVREDQKELSRFLAESDDVRRAIQRHVVLVERDQETVWARLWRLSHLNSSLSPTTGDIVHLLEDLTNSAPHDDETTEMWRELVCFSRRKEGVDREIIAAARPFALGRPDLEAVLEDVLEPLPLPEWQLKQEERRAASARESARALAERRVNFAREEAAIRAGELGWIHPIALAYLALYTDIDDALAPKARIAEFLGEDFVEMALAGLDAVLARTDLPSAAQVAESYAQSRRWNYVRPMIAAVCERVASGRGLSDVPLDAIMSVRLGLENDHFGDRIDQKSIEAALDAFLRSDPAAYERYVRLLIEPSLEVRQHHVPGLYGFVRSAPDRRLAVRLAKDWLTRFEDMPVGIELELIDALASSGEFAFLREIGRTRASIGFDSDDRRLNWQAAALFSDFDETSRRLTPIEASERRFLWFLRHRLGGSRFEENESGHAEPRLLGWIVAQFRGLWGNRGHPVGAWSGDTNDFDASDFLRGLINRLAGDPSQEATVALAGLSGLDDGYGETILHAIDQQRKARRETAFRGVTVARIRDAVTASPRAAGRRRTAVSATSPRAQRTAR